MNLNSTSTSIVMTRGMEENSEYTQFNSSVISYGVDDPDSFQIVALQYESGYPLAIGTGVVLGGKISGIGEKFQKEFYKWMDEEYLIKGFDNTPMLRLHWISARAEWSRI